MQTLNYLRETASQTAGPYVHIGLAPGAAGFHLFAQELGQTIAPEGTPGQRIHIEGLVTDGTGAPVKDVLLEVWHADSNGIYPHPEDPRVADVAPNFKGWGRVITNFDTASGPSTPSSPAPFRAAMARPKPPTSPFGWYPAVSTSACLRAFTSPKTPPFTPKTPS